MDGGDPTGIGTDVVGIPRGQKLQLRESTEFVYAGTPRVRFEILPTIKIWV